MVVTKVGKAEIYASFGDNTIPKWFRTRGCRAGLLHTTVQGVHCTIPEYENEPLGAVSLLNVICKN